MYRIIDRSLGSVLRVAPPHRRPHAHRSLVLVSPQTAHTRPSWHRDQPRRVIHGTIHVRGGHNGAVGLLSEGQAGRRQ